ncbi:alpha-1,3-mannosyl-glycoprotein 4-beta-N-acetylglucosaminyltransferase-like protein MGAT4E [Orycteropus afer afer]|uniref:Alpha-1,3-mannosyl-glycoprotein 4-beta-N-acetylglucosaminyltransferase-like protein MGAT4E n=1 Tax=Orycteropus afer afer TaxID=1230840 RepID=A0A8B6ZUJ0_ORYAF|nr:alpha-1,3-mannosyl-glycoprotein 4-beta-N-acetylglucosaminyltransferase-like protein MGAT4E [Orycteropus afer afer]
MSLEGDVAEEKKKIPWQIVEEQISSASKNHLRTFKAMQNNSSLFQHANYKILAGIPPQERKLLTVGISFVQHPHESCLLHTLQSLFQASSEPELSYIVVLVHLLNPDPEWLSQTVANISNLFKPHIETQKLLVIQGLLNGSSLPRDVNDTHHSSSCKALYSRQKTDYGLLMNFATNLSDYFLMIGDNVHCTLKFISTIYWTLEAWKEIPWMILEFSSLSFSGKVFHMRDLSRLTSFFLLFQDTPTDLLLSHFGFLLGQRVPISLTPYLFHSTENDFTSEDVCYQEKEKEEENEPENPPAQIYTNMMVRGLHFPEYAYFLNENYFQTYFLIPGNIYVVIFDEPQKVTRVQVLTGIGKRGIYQVEHGQVKLGYGPIQRKKGCTHYNLLGPLVKGKLDQKIYYEDFVEEVRCVQLLVTAFQDSKILITQIKIWIKSEEE